MSTSYSGEYNRLLIYQLRLIGGSSPLVLTIGFSLAEPLKRVSVAMQGTETAKLMVSKKHALCLVINCRVKPRVESFVATTTVMLNILGALALGVMISISLFELTTIVVACAEKIPLKEYEKTLFIAAGEDGRAERVRIDNRRSSQYK